MSVLICYLICKYLHNRGENVFHDFCVDPLLLFVIFYVNIYTYKVQIFSMILLSQYITAKVELDSGVHVMYRRMFMLIESQTAHSSHFAE